MMDNRKRCDGVGALFCVIGGGRRRQNSGIYHDFCLLRGPRKPISEAAVDKNYAFYSVFVYFGGRAGQLMKQKSTSANSNVLFKTIQNVCLACKETGPARLGEFHR